MITAISINSGPPPPCVPINSRIISLVKRSTSGLLLPIDSRDNLRWGTPLRKINTFVTPFYSKGRNARLGICSFQKPSSEGTSAGYEQHNDIVQLNTKDGGDSEMSYSVGQSSIPPFFRPPRLNTADQAFILFSLIACTTTVAFVSLIFTAIPTLMAMRRAALSLEKLADTAREELPGTMAAIRLSGMEISDLTLELSDLSQEISEGVRKSAQAVQAAEIGIRRIGVLASSKAMSMLQERANLPVVTIKPAMTSAAETTSHVVQRARRAILHVISLPRFSGPKRNESEM